VTDAIVVVELAYVVGMGEFGVNDGATVVGTGVVGVDTGRHPGVVSHVGMVVVVGVGTGVTDGT
jgi:hypothetical protein